jgi:hypothetical protein
MVKLYRVLKYLAKKKRIQQKKLENKNVLDETPIEENIELTVEEIPSVTVDNNDVVL